MPPDPIQVVALVARALERLAVPYLVGGSLASSRYGFPRTTQDVDLVADLTEEHVMPLVNELQDEFYIDTGMVREAIQKKSSFNVIHLSAAYKVDIFIVQSDPWTQQEMGRRRAERVDLEHDATTLYFCSPEDVILHKLHWYRLGNEVSERQWSDVLGVLKVQRSELDLSYLHHWAIELGLTDLLDQALRECGVTR